MSTRQSPAHTRENGGRVRAFLLLLCGGWRMVRVNLMFVAFCLPMATVGPALAALTGVLIRMREGERVRVAYHFCDAFEREALRAAVCSVFTVLLGVAFLLPARRCLAGAAQSWWLWLPFVLFAVLFLWLLCAFCFLLTLLGNGGLTLGAALGIGITLPLLCRRASLRLVLVSALFALLFRVLWPYSLPAVLLVGFAAYLWLVVRICLLPVRRLVPALAPARDREGE